jgi:beta-N-acetylhexosaminidase
VEAGCDAALDCWARMDEMVAMANALPDMSTRSRARLDAAMASADRPKSVEKIAALIDKRDALLSYAV